MDKGGQIVLAVEIGGVEVNPHPARYRSVERTRPAIGAGSARLLGWWKPANLDITGSEAGKCARHLRPDPVKALLDECDDLRTADVVVGKLVSRIFRKSRHAFAGRTLCIAQTAQDRIHPCLDRCKFFEPARVDFVRRKIGRRCGLQRPAIPFRTVRPRPHARCRIGKGQLPLHHGGLPLQRRQNFIRHDGTGAGLPITRYGRGAPGQRGDERAAALRKVGNRAPHLVDGALQQEIGRDQPGRLCRGNSFQFGVELGWQLRKPVAVGIGIVDRLDRMARIQKTGNIEIGPDVLDHDIGCVAPTADGYLAIGQGQAF